MEPINSRTERVLVVIPVAAILLTYSVLPVVRHTGIPRRVTTLGRSWSSPEGARRTFAAKRP
jgi:hypothetical protein